MSAILDQDLMEECKVFIEEHKEARHIKVMEHQKKKFENLWHRKQHSGSTSTNHSGKNGTSDCSNQDQFSTVNNKHWVVNLSSSPLSVAQEIVLSHGPNFAVNPKTPIPRICNSYWGSMPESQPYWSWRAKRWHSQSPETSQTIQSLTYPKKSGGP